jgi:hypothetical protein
MLTKTRLALAATLILGSATVAFGDESGAYDNRDAQAVQQTLTTRSVALPQSHAVSPAAERWMDRASQVFDGGR